MINTNANLGLVKTNFGDAPLGSILSIQCPLVESHFKIYSQFDCLSEQKIHQDLSSFPLIPYVSTCNNNVQCSFHRHIEDIKDEIKLNILNDLKISKPVANEIEQQTQNQALCPKWFKYRENRFTASLNNKLQNVKTPTGLKSIANKLVFGEKNKNNYIIQHKLQYGKYYEPIAIQKYEKYMSSLGRSVTIEKSGLVLDTTHFILGASPDGKVTDISCDICPYGILEVKCSEEYRDIDPKDVCLISKSACIEYNEDQGKIYLKKDHSYYAQVQMQLALTTQTWCDFIFYTAKEIAIDRIKFDHSYWISLKEKIFSFYFMYMLPELRERKLKGMLHCISHDHGQYKTLIK